MLFLPFLPIIFTFVFVFDGRKFARVRHNGIHKGLFFRIVLQHPGGIDHIILGQCNAHIKITKFTIKLAHIEIRIRVPAKTVIYNRFWVPLAGRKITAFCMAHPGEYNREFGIKFKVDGYALARL